MLHDHLFKTGGIRPNEVVRYGVNKITTNPANLKLSTKLKPLDDAFDTMNVTYCVTKTIF